MNLSKCNFRCIDQLLERVIANNVPFTQDQECLAISTLNILQLQVSVVANKQKKNVILAGFSN